MDLKAELIKASTGVCIEVGSSVYRGSLDPQQLFTHTKIDSKETYCDSGII